MLFVKPPGKLGQAWHQDERYIPTRDRSLVDAWIGVDDATSENGCLWVLPGSHRPGYLFPCKPPTDLVEYDGSDESFDFDAAGAVAVPVKAGDVVLFNGCLLHKSHRNRTRGYRRALVCHYMNSYSSLPWYELAPKKVGSSTGRHRRREESGEGMSPGRIRTRGRAARPRRRMSG
jgi:phytanoyl-CoA hydroxylase